MGNPETRAADAAALAGAVRPAAEGYVDPSAAGQGMDLYAVREAVRAEFRDLLRALSLVKRGASNPDVADTLAAIFGPNDTLAAAVLAPLRAALEGTSA